MKTQESQSGTARTGINKPRYFAIVQILGAGSYTGVQGGRPRGSRHPSSSLQSIIPVKARRGIRTSEKLTPHIDYKTLPQLSIKVIEKKLKVERQAMIKARTIMKNSTARYVASALERSESGLTSIENLLFLHSIEMALEHRERLME